MVPRNVILGGVSTATGIPIQGFHPVDGIE